MTREEREDAIERLNALKQFIGYDKYSEIIKATQKSLDMAIEILEQEDILDKVRTEILDCLKALDEIEKSGLNIYLPNEISGRRLTYQQCLQFIDKYRAESEVKDGNNNHQRCSNDRME